MAITELEIIKPSVELGEFAESLLYGNLLHVGGAERYAVQDVPEVAR